MTFCISHFKTIFERKGSLKITYLASEETTYDDITYRKNDNADKTVATLTEKDYTISKDSSPVLYDVCEKDTVLYKLLAFDDTVIVFTPGTKAAWGEGDDLLQNAYTITEYTLQSFMKDKAQSCDKITLLCALFSC